jgi:hypothetical protein
VESLAGEAASLQRKAGAKVVNGQEILLQIVIFNHFFIDNLLIVRMIV